MDATEETRREARRARRQAILRDDPRRQALRELGFMQSGYIEGMPDEPVTAPAPLPDAMTSPAVQPVDGTFPGTFPETFPGQTPYSQPSHPQVAYPQPEADTGDIFATDGRAWATDLIGDVPDSIGNEDLVTIGGPAAPMPAPAAYAPQPIAPDQMTMSEGFPLPQDAFPQDGVPGAAIPPMTGSGMSYEPAAEEPTPSKRRRRRSRDDEDDQGRRRHGGRIMRTLKRILLLLLLVAMFVGGFAAGLTYEQRQHPAVSAAFIETQLSECSDLATAKMHYNGLVHYESGDIPLINKKTFSMTYQAEVRAGIDLSQADVRVSGTVITIILPKAEIQTTSIDPASVKFFDQTWGLFSWESKDDAKTALEQAQEDLEENLDDMSLMEEANLNAERTVRGLVAPILKANDGYQLVVKTSN